MLAESVLAALDQDRPVAPTPLICGASTWP